MPPSSPLAFLGVDGLMALDVEVGDYKIFEVEVGALTSGNRAFLGIRWLTKRASDDEAERLGW